MPLVASTRMYNQGPHVRALWDDVLTRVAALSGVPLDIIAHAAPEPLSALWQRPDLGVGFMCGFPFARLAPAARPIPLAAPVSRESWAQGRTCYASHIVVAADGPIRAVGDLATARWGWTARDSQSGYHAPRGFLADTFGPLPQMAATVGGLINPTGVLAALRDGRIEAGAVDAFAYQLIERLEPGFLAGMRIMATTASRPMPMLVAARQLDQTTLAALRQALAALGDDVVGRGLLDRIGIARFASVEPSAYDILPRLAAETDVILEAAW